MLSIDTYSTFKPLWKMNSSASLCTKLDCEPAWILCVYTTPGGTTEAPSWTAASAPSPQISVKVSLDVIDPSAHVYPVSAHHTRFYM